MVKKAKFILTIIGVFLLLSFTLKIDASYAYNENKAKNLNDNGENSNANVLDITYKNDLSKEIDGKTKTITKDTTDVSFDEFNFPDKAFRDSLRELLPTQTKDNILTNEELRKIESLDLSANVISNLTGIEYFTELKSLDISLNLLKNVDLSKNIKLTYLNAQNNQLMKTLELPESIEILYLEFNYSLTNFELSKFHNLKIFYAPDVKLNDVDLSNLTEIIALDLENTGLNSINVKNNKKLEYLNVRDNNLTMLDVSYNESLYTLDVEGNRLEKLLLPVSSKTGNSVDFYSQQVTDGYQIVWYEGEKIISANEKVQMKGQTLTSKANAKKINVKYNSNGGSGSITSQKGLFGENIYLKQNTFTRNGYIFKGWSTSANISNVVYNDLDTIKLDKYPAKGNITLYAVWQPIKYSIQFDSNGGSGLVSQMNNLNYGLRYKLTTNTFTKEGYTFKGWSKNKESNVVYYLNNQNVYNLATKDGEVITLYAVWQKNEYNVNFKVDGKTTITKVSYGNKVQKIVSPNKTGYTFLGWYNEKTNEKYDFNIQVKEHINLVAKFRPNTYSITFNGNGSTNNKMDTIFWEFDKLNNLPTNTFIKKGYKFLGWSTSANGVVKYLNKASIKNLTSTDGANITLYAKWEKIKENFSIQSSNINTIYNGKAQTISITNIPSGSTILYRTSTNGSWTTKKPSRTTIGTTTIYFKISHPDYNTYEGNRKVTIKAKSIGSLSISSIGNKTYTGKDVKPSVSIKDGKTTLKNNTHYTISYGNNKKTGKAYVKITGKGNYTGTVTRYFYIVPKVPSISITAGRGNMTVKAKSTGANGYEISYATSKNGKYSKVASTSQNRKITRLTKGKKYYVKVRAYIVIDGKKVYSGYSSIKTVTIRK